MGVGSIDQPSALPVPQQGQPVNNPPQTPRIHPTKDSFPNEELIIKIVYVVAAIFFTMSLTAICAAMGPAGGVVAGVVLTGLIGYGIKKNVFGSKDFLIKVGSFAKTSFQKMRASFTTPTVNPKVVAPMVYEANAPVNVVQKSEMDRESELWDIKADNSKMFTDVLNAHRSGNGIKDLDGKTDLERVDCGDKFKIRRTKYKNEITKNTIYEVNEFGKGFYNGPNFEHFFERLGLMMETALKNLPPEAHGNLNKMCEFYENQLLVCMGNSISDGIGIQEGAELSTENKNKFNEKFNAAKAVLQDAFEDFDQVLADHGAEELLVLEKQFVLERGRPTIINTFKIPGSERTFVSIQKPLLEHTQPSSIRNKEGLCNAVTTHSGYINDAGEIVITHEASRHSSTPPIAIKDPYIRQKVAAGNVYQELVQLVRNKVEDDIPVNSEQEPIELDWNNMILLTPKTVDAARNKKKVIAGAWTGEGETLMLKETLQSLYRYANRPVKVEINGQPVWVKINISAMNLGCNTAVIPTTAMGRLPNAKIQESLNAQGFMEFEIQTDNYLHKHFEDDDALSLLFNQYCQLKNYKTNQEFHEIKQYHESALKPLQERLEVEFAKEPLDKPAIDGINKEIITIQKAIRKEALKCFKNKTEAYEDRADELAAKRQEILTRLDELLSIDESGKEHYLNLKIVFMNQAEFARSIIEKDNLKPNSIMNSQAIYIDTISLMDTWVSFFCKSGEDRTGAVDNEVASRVIQRTLDVDVPFDDIRKIVYEASISRQVTRENSDAEGLQISPLFVPESIKLRIWAQKKIAKLAKGVVKRDVGIAERVGSFFGRERMTAWQRTVSTIPSEEQPLVPKPAKIGLEIEKVTGYDAYFDDDDIDDD